ncbi:nitrogen assimilation transcriptional regulator NAC [Biostraticola tofi]|uniref:LysR family nitrogen assimilation transcriptional regulator n=1 Tax=Biostraticola tofi TaxID=466109 RepID=A0A4R3Z2T0_9GAMM|nr:nitrogen assimilation transcriptional regulator NAC [Biostraticola tofi]TCV98194.1 LysR family nitrogen assimilation transcriptional regulator [Biostraticola tofi]
MNLRRLKYFVKIVDIGSLTQAAEVLHIAQPALSQQVATLEGELSQKLLIRTKRGVTPTEAGKILYSHARAILQQCELAQKAVGNVGQVVNGQVSIGIAPGTSSCPLIMPLLQSVRAKFPLLTINLHENSSLVLNEKVSNGHLDMAIHYDPATYQGINSVTLLKEDLYLVGTHDNPGKNIELNEVALRQLFLARDFSAIHKRMAEAFTLRRLSAKIIGEIDAIATLSAAIASGMGAAVLPESSASAVVRTANAWMSRITSPGLALPLTLNLSSRMPLSPSAAAVKSLLTSLATQSMPLVTPHELLLAS